jgi:AraC-like DNA-binding protein
MTHQTRNVIDTPLFAVRTHRALATDALWSDDFTVDSPRWVIPQRGAIAFSQSAQRSHDYVCTPLDVLAVDASAPYRMRRFACDYVTSVVVIPKTVALTTGAFTLPLTQLIALRRLLVQINAGNDVTLAIEELCAALHVAPGDGAERTHHRAGNVAHASHSTRTMRAVRTAQAYVYEHATERLSLATLAAVAHVSPFHLARAFKRELGVTLHQRQLQVRMLHAVDRIANGENNLTALAHALGFSSHAHFSAAFREYLGASPSAYRRNMH